MDKRIPKRPGSFHGQQLLRGFDNAPEAYVRPGPLVAGRIALRAGPGEPVIMAKARAAYDIGRFGRLFARSTYQADPAAIHELAETMKEANDPSGDHPSLPLGIVFLGQFLDHDLTLDATTVFGRQEDPEAITDFRTINFDLDSVYGPGPGVARHMYDTSGADGKNPVKLLIDAGREFDLPRNSQHSALIGDLRNDENFMISQLHLAFLKFHNAIVDKLRADDPGGYSGPLGNAMLFADASKLARWHYQWIIVHEFLPAIVGQEVVDDVLNNGRKLYLWETMGASVPYMPIEFSTAAYRLGHTILRQDYQVNAATKKDLFDLPVFGSPPLTDVSDKLDFSFFFGAKAQRARKFDAKITAPVFKLPFIDEVQDPPISLAERNMLRGQIFGLPSGQEVAVGLNKAGIRVPVYSNADLGIDGITGLGGGCPLFFYILKESEFAPTSSKTLGPVGGRIVAEVFLGLLTGIEGNYLHDMPGWMPTLSGDSTYSMEKLIAFAGA